MSSPGPIILAIDGPMGVAIGSGEPATASTQQARGTLVHGELSARQADGETMASAGSEFLQFEN